MSPQSLFDKLWNDHLVSQETDETPAILYIDLHLVHEVTSPQAFAVLKERGLQVRRPDKTLATLDHSTPTLPANAHGELPYETEEAKAQVKALIENCKEHGINLYGIGDDRRGIVHVIGPERGATQPGKTIVCGDSHTSTHGAFGALAFGIGTTEVGHVLATQCVLQRKPKTMRVNFTGVLPSSVSAKDMALAMIARIGADGGQGYAIEFGGAAVEGLSMEQRMTLCNMSIEAGARFGLIAPDQTTYDWLEGRDLAPIGEAWEQALTKWRKLYTEKGAQFEKEVTIDVSSLKPMVTFGVSPDAATSVDGNLPDLTDQTSILANEYMKLAEAKPLSDNEVNRVFIGSCTNSRMSDLRAAAEILEGRKVADGVVMLIVPGSEKIKQEAEQEGLHEIFLSAGAQWREPGCSMCIGMNGDRGKPGELVVSTSNRNFIGRQGKDVRTVLASPATAAASAIAGHIADPRQFMRPRREGV